jgi:hypothetical protein
MNPLRPGIEVEIPGALAVELVNLLSYAALALPEGGRKRLLAARLETAMKKAITRAQELDEIL